MIDLLISFFLGTLFGGFIMLIILACIIVGGG